MRGRNYWWDLWLVLHVKCYYRDEISSGKQLEDTGMSGNMLILFEAIPCEGVKWIHLRNWSTHPPAADATLYRASMSDISIGHSSFIVRGMQSKRIHLTYDERA